MQRIQARVRQLTSVNPPIDGVRALIWQQALREVTDMIYNRS